MTIGIGVLGSSEIGRAKEIVADTAILIADTMGSFGDAYSHSRLHKALMFPEHNVYALVADEVDKGVELVPVICKFLAQEAPKEQRHYGNIINGIAKGCFFYKGEKFTILELPKLRLPPEVFDPRTLPPELNAVVQAEWDRFYVGCDLLIATFDGLGKAYLLSVDGQNGELHNVSFPGFGAIGCGADNAMFWLSTRQHTLGMLPVRAAYHAYEAKLMAEASAHVNQHLDIVVATKDEHWFSSRSQLIGRRLARRASCHQPVKLEAMAEKVRTERYGNVGKSPETEVLSPTKSLPSLGDSRTMTGKPGRKTTDRRVGCAPLAGYLATFQFVGRAGPPVRRHN